ncbi:1-aminocyclopropane-1-carboxylate deaminase-related [Anaeramoeba ignava]|uniref:1-aminocyclopropane-1-carboxylate deaminase-related n=1 Tax=Anaeramoeba ignava TaxID=1746090 RepID=A0A9Q0LS72_ANAIG|nr:1-aminocyclopropane-1-carboxylate deaminase-related [Anaeramoeba ignava]|eukprot:Anaeramoba_ignava/a399_28.p1 GENE.a399_28~~a399_28.p1  ORF type:complete len:337 (-),score=119.48 a399_28:117-1127(-)
MEKKVKYIPEKLNLANLPTPIIHCEEFSRKLGIQIDIKQDDMTGCLTSGNKIRKLEFLLADAKKQNATIVLTCGGFQSNHSRATAVAARQVGLKSLLFLRVTEHEKKVLAGNFLIDKLVGAQFEFITAEQYQNRSKLMKKKAEELKKIGENPYIIPEGGTNLIGIWGYIHMFNELVEQHKEFPYTHIYCAVGTIGTMTGLLIGRDLLDLNHVKIIGVPVCGKISHFTSKMNRLVEEFNQEFGTDLKPQNYELLDGYIGPGYSVPYKEEIDVIKDLAQSDGVILDTCYTGKTFYALVDQIKKNQFNSEKDKILFILTGGLFSLFTENIIEQFGLELN